MSEKLVGEKSRCERLVDGVREAGEGEDGGRKMVVGR